MRIPSDSGDGIEVDMAPLIDCVFLLLIFFLVASSLKEWDIEAELPQTGPAALAAKVAGSPVIVRLSRGGTIQWKDRKFPMRDRRKFLSGVAKILAESPGGPVEIRAHPESKSGDVLTLADALRLAGARVVDIRVFTEVQ